MQQNTISNNTFTSSVQDITQGNIEYGITPPQFYCSLFCITLVLIVGIISFTRLIQTLIIRINFVSPKFKESLKNEIINELNSTDL